MKLNLLFTADDYKSLVLFEKAVRKQLGNDVHVGTQSLCVYLYFPSTFSNTFHFNAPLPNETYECELKSSIPNGNVKLTFNEKDFKSRRDFDNGVARQMDKTATVLTDANGWGVAYYFDYPKELLELRRPQVFHQDNPQLDFVLESSVPEPKK